ncbi:MarR family winged helix-turn-helix transcriptional regulator [Agarivorans sp. QJM3NY_25]|uniref:MarR family winged helix-turn-helix transcriptional regulator n=1 Tax=Agarivorans sp. QJM3NY_25 TaxID=3421430 RepID=UPI003D7DE4ED
MPEDKVDKILAQWRVARPDLDCSVMGVVGRLGRTHCQWRHQLDQIFNQYGLSNIEFDIMATMRRSGEAVTPTQLYQTLMISSGAVSKRIEELVQRNLVQRIASEQDRRSCKVRLTEQGQVLLDQALNAHVANMNKMLSPLDPKEQQQLAGLLKKLLLSEGL